MRRKPDELLSAFAEYFCGLSDNAERRPFLDAARTLLERDPEIRRRPRSQRSALLNAPIETDDQELTIVMELSGAIDRLMLSSTPGEPVAERVRQADLIKQAIGKAFGPTPAGKELLEATLRLRELSDAAKVNESRRSGKKSRSSVLTAQSHEQREIVARLSEEAAKLRTRKPPLSKNARAKALNKPSKRIGRTWTSAAALVEFARRHNVTI
jgi:hypothetical protein